MDKTKTAPLREKEGLKITSRLKRLRPSMVFGCIVLVILVVALVVSFNKAATRTEAYKDSTGAAGLEATIDYKCPNPCEQKFNFNVYVLGENGQQVGVFRPTEDGKVQFALAEGNYVMLIGKQLGNAKTFPQEPLALKSGKVLELGLQYN